MIRVGLTGGIATGKSTFLEFFKKFRGDDLAVFDCDAEVRKLLGTFAIIAEIVAAMNGKA